MNATHRCINSPLVGPREGDRLRPCVDRAVTGKSTDWTTSDWGTVRSRRAGRLEGVEAETMLASVKAAARMKNRIF